MRNAQLDALCPSAVAAALIPHQFGRYGNIVAKNCSGFAGSKRRGVVLRCGIQNSFEGGAKSFARHRLLQESLVAQFRRQVARAMSRHQQKRDISLSQHGSNSSAGLVDKSVIEQGAVKTLLVDEPQGVFDGGCGDIEEARDGARGIPNGPHSCAGRQSATSPFSSRPLCARAAAPGSVAPR